MSRRRFDPESGRDAVRAWSHAGREGTQLPRDVLALAVRYSLEELATRHPGRTCEVRVPPFSVVQCLPGPRHTRGTPPNVIETDPRTWLELATGAQDWAEAIADGAVLASGERADLGLVLPLWRD